MSAFAYQPLVQARHEIRLLQIFPCDSTVSIEGEEDIIKCTIEHVSLDDKPEFQALSYTWGGGACKINLNGTIVTVTENLESALQHLRAVSSTKFLWVDAICINQQDDCEKSWQVQQMRQIYANASMVIVWLGPEEDESGLALRKLQQIGDGTFSDTAIDAAAQAMRAKDALIWDIDLDACSRIQQDAHYDSDESSYERYIVELIRGTTADDAFPLEAMRVFLARRYWQRIWVLQEVAVAKSFIFFCGNMSIPGPCLTNAMMSFRMYTAAVGKNMSLERNSFDEVLVKANLNGSAMSLFECRSAFNTAILPAYDKSLIALLSLVFVRPEETSTLQSTDPRDRIFAFLGLAADADNLKIYPDYSKTCQTVYTDVARALLLLGDLQVLSLCHFQRSLSGLPSWVPDWSANIPEPLLGPPSDSRNVGLFSASRDSKALVRIGPNMGIMPTLEISGKKVGDILEVSHILGRGASKPGRLDILEWFKKLEGFSHYGGDIYGSKQQREEAIGRMLIADHEIDNQTAHRRIQKSPRDAYLWLSDRIGELQQRYISPMDIYEDTIKYMTNMMRTSKRRRPFVTTRGYLGIGPVILEPGDLAVIFLGADIPFVLRPGDDGHYQLVGEAYIHGIMDGELMTKDVEIRTFKLY